jgi:hypothetical protein
MGTSPHDNRWLPLPRTWTSWGRWNAASGQAGATHNYVGWLQDATVSACGVACMQVRPGFLPAAVSSGKITLSAGTSGAIANWAVTADTLIRLSNTSAAGRVGALSVTLRPASSFVIHSMSSTDQSTVFWEIVQY